MKKKWFIAIGVAIILIAWNYEDGIRRVLSKPTIFDGARWGMSIGEVQALYKVMPSKVNSDQLVYLEKLPNSVTEFSVTYKFDAKTGLGDIIIKTPVPLGDSREEDIKNFQEIFFENWKDMTEWNLKDYDVKLLYEAKDQKGDSLFADDTYVYDRIYDFVHAKLRSRLTKTKMIGDKYSYSAKILLIPPEYIWTDVKLIPK